MWMTSKWLERTRTKETLQWQFQEQICISRTRGSIMRRRFLTWRQVAFLVIDQPKTSDAWSAVLDILDVLNSVPKGDNHRVFDFSGRYNSQTMHMYIKNPIDNFWNVCAHERLVWLSCCTDDTSPYARMRTFSRCVSHFAHFIQRTCTGSRCLSGSVCLSKIIPSRHHITPLGVPEFSAFPPVLSSSAALPTGIRLNPCATPLWGGPSGHLADPTPNTGYEPKFCMDVSSKRTPINLPSRKSSVNLENNATIAASEDFDHLPQHSGASSTGTR